MIDIEILKCIFAEKVYDYTLKLRTGVKCNKDKLKCGIDKSYNLYKIADNYTNNNCTITGSTYNTIVSYQTDNSLIIEICC